MKCPSCGVELSRNESQSGCPLCDWTPGRQARLTARKAEAKATVEETEIKIDGHPIYGFADRLAQYLLEQYRDEVPRWASSPIVWRNRQCSSHVKYNGKQDCHQIIFGYQSVGNNHDEGFKEYKTWTYLWGWETMTGLKAVWAEVLHEFAHALQVERAGRVRGRAHTNVWGRAVRELQTLVPFEDALEIAGE